MKPTAVRPNDPELAPAFRKDPEGESFLSELNAALAGFEHERYAVLGETLPTLHVIGAPRSGTTLLHQVVCSGLEVGSITNLIAAFWRAPVTGLRLAQGLGADRVESRFDSDFGRTRGIAEPHEFGYFWNHHLRYPDLAERGDEHEDTIDWDALAQIIRNMAAAGGAPFVFKPMLLTWHLERMVQAMPRTCYAWIRRSRRDTAISLLRMRRSMFGDDETWASLRPRAVPADEPAYRQVAAQVVLLEQAIDVAVARIGPDRVVELTYDGLCNDPVDALERVRALMGRHGCAPALLTPDLPPFSPDPSDALEEEFGEQIDAAVAHYEDLFRT